MFSEKYGYKNEKILQHESISDTLRNRIWNLFYINEIKAGGLGSKRLGQALNGEQTIEEKIADRFGFVLDVKGDLNTENIIKNHVLELFKWYEVYDFVEFHISFLEGEEKQTRIKQYNNLFEQEKAGYRFVIDQIAPITNSEEINSIELSATTLFEPVNEHMRKALVLYADLEEPDYQNSIKESICAVEAMCSLITGQSGKQATLGKTIKQIEDSGIHIHPSMKNAFSSLYGFASDEDGIRHGGTIVSEVPEEDAKFVLITCSAFVNYLMQKYSKMS